MDLNQIKPKPRPDDVPVGNVKRESGAVTESIRPKTIEKKPRDRAKEFGDLEYRADLDTQLSWNPIARLGFDPDKHKVLRSGLDPMAAYLRDITNFGKKALEKGYISPEEEKKIKDDNIITGSDVSVSPIIAHEFTHRGFNILRNKMNENPEAFEEKYGKQARRILEATSEGDLKSDFEEYYVELFDDLDTKFNSDAFRIRGFGDDLRRTVQSSKIGPNYPLSDSSDRYRNVRIRQIKTFQDNVEKYRKKGKLGGLAQGINQDINNGILGLMDAAQDILTEQGEPPKAKRKSLSFFEKLGKMIGFDEGGLADRKFNKGGAVMDDQMQMAFKDDGMTKDPVSGNEIPPGSLAKEVRDDIPAMLSEGEYVVPADVLRYYGVNFFENLRNQAKSGLQTMENTGRIGGDPMSPQQVQQNMSGQPMTNAPPAQPVAANTGPAMLGQQSQTGTNTATTGQPVQNPFTPMNFSTVGFSQYQQPTQKPTSVTSTRTYVNADNTSDIKIVTYVNGVVTPPADVKFTQPPYYLQGSPALAEAIKGAPKGGGSGGTGGSPPDTDPPDPNAWARDITDPLAWAKENLQKDNILALGVSVARTRALAIAAEAEGLDDLAFNLRKEARKVVDEKKLLQLVPEGGMNGTVYASPLQKEKDLINSIFSIKDKELVSPKDPETSAVSAPKPAPDFSSATDASSAAGLAYSNASEGVDPIAASQAAAAGVNAGVSPAAAAEAAAAGATSIGSGEASTIEETGQESIGPSGSGSGAFNKGGLMQRKKRKAKK